MSDKPDCKWCGYSYAEVQAGREYLVHEGQWCELKWMRKMLGKLLQAKNDHMTACDRTMGATHYCTCGADEARKVLEGQ